MVRDFELLITLKEEGSLLREEERGAGIGDHLLDVRLDLREVGIRGAVEGEVVSDAPADVPPEFRVGSVVRPPTRGNGTTVHLRSRLRVDVQDDAAGEARQPLEPARLTEERRIRLSNGRPGILEAGMLDLAVHVDPPGLHVHALIAQALERDSDLDLIAPIGHPTLGLVHEVGAQVDGVARRRGRAGAGAASLRSLAEDAVRLDA